MFPRPLFLLALALLAPASAGDSAPATYTPSVAFALQEDSTLAFVSWLPGAALADSYRVYGLDASGPHLLLDTADTAAPLGPSVVVSGGFAGYAVSGVIGGAESALRSTEICSRISTYPPPPSVSVWTCEG